MRFWLLLWFAIAPLGAAQAALRVFACEPEWASLATELGDGKLDVSVPPPPFRIPTIYRRGRA